MSESDTMFNERDRRCVALQVMLSTDPTYDNRTIAYTLKMQIRTVQHLRPRFNVSDDLLEVVKRKDTARKTQTKEFIKKVQAMIDETPQRPIWQIARDLGVSHTTVNACVKEDLKCRSYRRQTSQILTEKTKNLMLIKSVRPPSSADLNPLDYFVWSYVENITNMTSHNTKASMIAEYSPSSCRRLWKRHAPSSGSVWRQWLRLKAATLNRCQLYNRINFFNKSFKIKL